MSQATETNSPMNERVADLAWRIGRELDGMRKAAVLHSPSESRTAIIAANESFTVPAYVVGSNRIEVFLDGVFCAPGTDAAVATYAEVGNAGTTSTGIMFHQDIPVEYDLYIRVN